MSHDSHPSTASAQRIRLARRTAGLSQAQLALELAEQLAAQRIGRGRHRAGSGEGLA